MNNNFLTKIGLANIDIGVVLLIITIVILILLIMLIVSMSKIKKLNDKYYFFMKGKNANSLEDEIMQLFEDNRQIKSNISLHSKDIRKIYRQLETTYQKMGMVKYDAFNQMGGKLSFCIVLLDQNDNGFLLNSVHTTDANYSYIKRIEMGTCNIDLSNEERVALQKAKSGQEVENEAN